MTDVIQGEQEKRVQAVLNGNRRALARSITHVENNTDDASTILGALFAHTGNAHLIGITGAPGTGKSSLVNQLALEFRRQEKTVGIIAVDPTSPFSGGAILGDRIRMRDLSGDSGIFIRSMASRGNLGGLARATADVCKVLDSAGFDVILIETVGAGQSEVDVAKLAHTVVVVEAPNMGDDIQAIKAGILEIADILVVNKSDDPRSKNTERALRGMLEIGHRQKVMAHHGQMMEVILPPELEGDNLDFWEIPICLTQSLDGEGIPELIEQTRKHRDYLIETGDLRQREIARAASELEFILGDTLLAMALETAGNETIRGLVDSIVARELLPQKAVDQIIAKLFDT